MKNKHKHRRMHTDRVLSASPEFVAQSVPPKVRSSIVLVLDEVEKAVGIHQRVLAGVVAGGRLSVDDVQRHGLAYRNLMASIATARLLLIDPPSASVQ